LGAAAFLAGAFALGAAAFVSFFGAAFLVAVDFGFAAALDLVAAVFFGAAAFLHEELDTSIHLR
jgi:hypothetical protein